MRHTEGLLVRTYVANALHAVSAVESGVDILHGTSEKGR